MAPTRQSTFRLYDAVLNGRLEEILDRYYHEEHLGQRRIAERLERDHGVCVSFRTVGRWWNDLQKEKPA